MQNGITTKGWFALLSIVLKEWLVSNRPTKTISDQNDQLLYYLLLTSDVCNTILHTHLHTYKCAPTPAYTCVCAQSCPTLCDPMDVTCQAPLSMGFFRQEY